MQRHLRLRSRQDFLRLRQEGQVVQNRCFKLSFISSGLTHHRYGLIVTGRLGKAARRNRLRRQVREILRLLDPQLAEHMVKQPDQPPRGYDMVLIAKPAAMQATFDILEIQIKQLLQRANLL